LDRVACPVGPELLEAQKVSNEDRGKRVIDTTAAVSVPCASEYELVDRHRHGDPLAFEEIYQRHADMVYNLSWRLCGDREEAADLLQEIFLRVYRHLGKFRGRSSLKTWIYRVAVNHCRSRLGRRRPRELAVREAAWTRLADPGPSPEEVAVASEAARRLERALQRLPRRFREAVVLRDLEGLSYHEIATVAGIRIGTVRSRIARGREQLRRIVREESS
jgi:RNA polymerase sigma-70 factor (ECF subfamily)